ncbi:Integral membrane protein GPR155 [Nymphon striatum]|nr:Integral membrane protein GPR155 [Nymphon striatum]
MLITCVKSNDTTNTVEDLKFTGILKDDLNCYIAPSGFLVPKYPIQCLWEIVLADDVLNSTSISDENSAFAELIPAVSQCFIIMLGGYIAGRSKIISPTEAKGLNMFVSYASLPSLIFISMATLNFSNVNWMFLVSVFIAKSTIFFLVAFVTSIVNWGQNFGKAGLYAIFCTQSNDFALGYPIIAALYSKSHPEYASYLYLVAPISLCILNPIGFVLMEIDKEKSSMFANSNRNEGESSTSKYVGVTGKGSVAARVTLGVIRNPIVIMTLLGIISNFVFDKVLPDFVYSVLMVTGSAFSATALFLLGLNMVGKVQALRNEGTFLLPCLLIVIKIIALPLAIKEVISLLAVGSVFSDMGSPGNITEYGFLYGTFPTAPSVFVYASAYGIAIDIIASSMVACTFLSAPLMFISAKMISLDIGNPRSYYSGLSTVVFYLSIASAICSVWVLLIMYLSKKYRRVPHIFTILLICGQLLAGLGVWVDYFHNPGDNNSAVIHANFLLVTIGIYSTRFMATVIAISTALLQIKSLCLVLKMRKYAPILSFGGQTVQAPLAVTTAGTLMMETCPSVLFTMQINEFEELEDEIRMFVFFPAIIFVLYCVFLPLSYKPMKYHNELTFMITKPLAAIVVALDLFCLLVTLAATVFNQYFSHKMEFYQQLLTEDKEDLIPDKERKERIKSSMVKRDSCSSIKIDTEESPKKSSKESPYKTRRDEILCENFGICKRKSYKDQLLVTGYETKKKVPAKIEKLSFQFSLRGLGLPVGADRYSKPFVSDEKDPKNETSNRASINCATDECCSKCSIKNKKKCNKLIENYQAIVVSADNMHLEPEDTFFQPSDEHEYTPHLVLVIYVCITMLADVSTGSCILLLDKPTGIYIELEFLNSILTYFLGVVLFFLFGIDSKLILVPINNLWQKLSKKGAEVTFPELQENDEFTIHTCEQFRTYHLDKCVRDIVKDTRWRLRLFKSVFWGKDLVSWLVKVGLAKDRVEAINYGRALLNGRIIKHFEEKFHFQDALYFYVFISNSSNPESEPQNGHQLSTSEQEILLDE